MSVQLRQNETELGCHNVQVATFQGFSWCPSGPPLRAIITDTRLILIPRKAPDNCNPAIIPARCIRWYIPMLLGKKPGLMLQLKSGERIHLLVSWGQGNKITRDIKQLMLPPPPKDDHTRTTQVHVVAPFIEV